METPREEPFESSGERERPFEAHGYTQRGDHESSHEIWVMGSDGTNEHVVTTSAGHDDFAPEWSPDGGKIVFLSTPVDAAGEIYVTDADGSNVTRLTTSTGEDDTPCGAVTER